MNRTLVHSLFAATFALGLTACGGSDDPAASPAPAATPAPAPAPSTDTTITGSAVKGPVSGATITVKRADGSNNNCGTTTTTATGSYSLTTACVGDLVVEVTGGSYVDEATGANTTLTSPLKVIVSASGGSTTAAITPLTTLAFGTNFGGEPATAAAYQAQLQKVATYFGMSGVNLVQTIPNVSSTTDAYGRYLAAISRYLNGKSVSEFLSLNFANNTAFQTAFNTAMQAVGGISVTFDASVLTGTTSGGGNGASGGTATLVVTGQAAGVTIPSVTIQNIPKPGNQSEFCGELQSDATFKSLQTQGATLTVNSCTFANNVGTVNASLNVSGFNIAYNLTYTYQ